METWCRVTHLCQDSHTYTVPWQQGETSPALSHLPCRSQKEDGALRHPSQWCREGVRPPEPTPPTRDPPVTVKMSRVPPVSH